MGWDGRGFCSYSTKDVHQQVGESAIVAQDRPVRECVPCSAGSSDWQPDHEDLDSKAPSFERWRSSKMGSTLPAPQCVLSLLQNIKLMYLVSCHSENIIISINRHKSIGRLYLACEADVSGYTEGRGRRHWCLPAGFSEFSALDVLGARSGPLRLLPSEMSTWRASALTAPEATVPWLRT